MTHNSAQSITRNQQLKRGKKERLKSKNGYAQRIGKQLGESVESVLKKKRKAIQWEGFAENRNVLILD